MLTLRRSILLMLFMASILASVEAAEATPQQQSQSILHLLETSPLAFTSAPGLAPPAAHYVGRLHGGEVSISDQRVMLGFVKGQSIHRFDIEPVSDTKFSLPIPLEPLDSRINYLRGKDPTMWVRDLRPYQRLRFQNVFPGTKVEFYGNKRDLEFDVILAPQADLENVRFQILGADKTKVNEEGDLLLEHGRDIFVIRAPIAFQMDGPRRTDIKVSFQLLTDSSLGFKADAYDRTRELIIDPIVEFSSYLGGNSTDSAYDVAVDTSGFAYITGYSGAPDFPVSGNALDRTRNGFFSDAFVTKINTNTGAIIYSTYLGGTGFDIGSGIAVNKSGNAIIVGRTTSRDFPTAAPIQSSFGGHQDAIPGFTDGDGFITCLSSDGSSLVYSTYLGGSRADELRAVAIGPDDSAFVVGNTASADFSVRTSLQTNFNGMPFAVGGTAANGDVFFAKISAQGALEFSSFLGGSGNETGSGVSVDSDGKVYLAGSTSSDDFPTRNPLQPRRAGQSDAFIAKIAADGSQLLFSTYLGGSGTEEAHALVVDRRNNVIVVGTTYSSNFPVRYPIQPAFGGIYDGFAAKISETGGELKFASYLGGEQGDEAHGVDVDSGGFIYIVGSTKSSNFPLKDAAQSTLGRDPTIGITFDAFALQLRPDGSELVYSSFLGGSGVDTAYGVAVDANKRTFLAGTTFSPNFPLKRELQSSLALGQDAFLSTLSPGTVTANLSVSSIYPVTGGDRGTTTVVLRGSNLSALKAVILSGSGFTDEVAEIIATSEDGTSAVAQFDLYEVPRGSRTLIVRDSDGGEVQVPGAFTVEPHRAGRLWTNIVGRSVVRTGRENRFTVAYGNEGNNDAKVVPLWIWGTPEDATWKLDVPTGPTIREGDDPSLDTDPDTITFDGARHLAFYLPIIPAQGSGAIDISINFPNPGPITLDSILNEPFFEPRPDNNQPYTASEVRASGYSTDVFIDTAYACIGGLYDIMVTRLGGNLPPGCAGAAMSREAFDKIMNNAVPERLLNRVVTRDTEAISQIKVTRKVAQLLIECAGLQSDTLRAFDLAELAHKAIDTIEECKKASKGCEQGEFCRIPDSYPINGRGSRGYRPAPGQYAPSKGSLTGESRGSIDPNEKSGPLGYAGSPFMNTISPLSYAILFENLPAATAAAQEVKITDQLDATKLDLSSLSLGTIRFGNKSITPPPGLKSFDATIDLRPDKNEMVRITASLDTSTSTLTWYLRSVDPSTGDFPDDPNAGFLPPNTTPPLGEGRVEYIVTPIDQLTDGAEIKNSAYIVFDQNAPIITNTWINTFDFTPPKSNLRIRKKTNDGRIFLSWTGSDNASGIKDYSFLVSEDGGLNYREWSNTAGQDEIFEGLAGKRYSFLGLATDNAGNSEIVVDENKSSQTAKIKKRGCKLSVNRACQRPINPGTVCTFTTKYGGGARHGKKMRYLLETEKSIGNFERSKRGVIKGDGKNSLKLPITQTSRLRSLVRSPACVTNGITVEVK